MPGSLVANQRESYLFARLYLLIMELADPGHNFVEMIQIREGPLNIYPVVALIVYDSSGGTTIQNYS